MGSFCWRVFLIYPWSPMHLSVYKTFLGIIQIMTWCVYVLVIPTIIQLAIWDARRAVGSDTRKAPKTAFMRFMQRHGYTALCIASVLAVEYVQGHLTNSPEPYIRVIGGSVIALTFSLLLFSLKILVQVVYGALEFVFGLASCGFSLSSMGAEFTAASLIGLVSSVYLMIRAMDNIKKGLDERAKNKETLLDGAETGKGIMPERSQWLSGTCNFCTGTFIQCSGRFRSIPYRSHDRRRACRKCSAVVLLRQWVSCSIAMFLP